MPTQRRRDWCAGDRPVILDELPRSIQTRPNRALRPPVPGAFFVKKSALPKPLRGIIPPMVTPLADRDTLDAEGTERLVDHLITGGVHGLFILGTTGEAP